MSDDDKTTQVERPKGIVHRDHLDWMQEQLDRLPDYELNYTIGGRDETVVHTSRKNEMRAHILEGERTLAQASQDMDMNFTFASHEGYAWADFNKAAEPDDPTPPRDGPNIDRDR